MSQYLAQAREAKAKHAKDASEKAACQKITLLKNQLASAKEENNALKQELLTLKRDIENIQERSTSLPTSIFEDLNKNRDQNQKDYLPETIALALEIKTLSPKVYSLLEKQLNFPKERYIEDIFNKTIGNLPKDLTNLECINKIVENYKKKAEISASDPIDACLAVDAICFSADVKITENCEVYGIEIDESMQKFTPDNLFSLFTENPDVLEKFINLNYESMIKSAFVFQIQPYNIKMKPFIVHIYPSANGKANETIVSILSKIREEVKKRRINIKSYAFDGDNAYLELHKIYYESYIHSIIQKETINIKKTQVIRTVSDYLHILKRLRYRLLNSTVHAGFDQSANPIILDDIQNILNNVPPVVWCNEQYTKMHDKLPLELFKLGNFLKLIEENHFAAAAFWYPIALSLTAITSQDIGYQNRLFLLQTSLFFLAFYKDNLENADEITLRQRKYGDDRSVMFYTNELLIEFSNTLYSHIQLMSTIDEFCFDRNSTTPLEHKFGLTRRRAHDVHTLQKFLRTVSSLQAVEQKSILQENEEICKIHCRVNSVGVSVEPADLDENLFLVFENDDNAAQNFAFSPQTCAKAILALAGFDFPYTQYIQPDEVIDWLFAYLSELVDDIPTQRKKRHISMNQVRLGVKEYSRAFQLIKQSNSASSKRTKDQIRTDELYNLLFDKFGEHPTRQHLRDVLLKIKENDPTGPIPPVNGRKEQMINFLKENLHIYYLFIQSL